MFSQPYYFHKIWKNQWMPEDKLREHQDKALIKLINHAYETVPYYKKLLKDSCIHPSDIKGIDDLKKIPVTSKEMLRKAGMDMVSSKFLNDDLFIQTTGGSNGEPITIYRNNRSVNLGRASKLRTFVTNGYKFNWTIAELHGFSLKSKGKFYHKFGIHKTVNLPASLKTEDQLDLLNELNAECLDCFPNRLEELNNYLSGTINNLRPKLIFTNSETLTEKVRRNTEEIFNIFPLDIYGSTEFQFAAWECAKHEGYHINSDLIQLEISDSNKYSENGFNETTGEIIGTDLTNYAMPLIRYNTGDIGILKNDKCSCGRSFPLLKEIRGRENQFLVLPSGRKLSGTQYIDSILIENKNINRYYAHQNSDKSLKIFLIKKAGIEINQYEILNRIKNDCEGLRTEITFLKTLPKTVSGKFLLFTSDAAKKL